MKAITTRYRPATRQQGARIIAFDQDGNRAVVSCELLPNTSDEDKHHQAARELCKRMKWSCVGLIPGTVKGGYVFVFAGRRVSEC